MVEEFELSLTQGAWDQDRWGAAAFPAAAGAELKAWFSSPPDGGVVDARFVKRVQRVQFDKKCQVWLGLHPP